MRKKPKRIICEWCSRRRLAKFMEWRPDVECWQCKGENDCADAIHRQPAKREASR